MNDCRTWDVVTGGAGFIGSHLAGELLRRGRKVRIVDDFSTGKMENVPEGAEVIKGDVVDLAPEALQDAENVYHLAAMASVPRSMAEPLRSHRATVESTVALLEAGERAGVRSFVLASSSSVYGDVPGLPKREDHIPAPVSPYALGKFCSELYASHWAAHRSLKTVCLRFFNVYGPRQDPDSPYAAVIPIFLRHLQNDDPIPIYGKGDQTRDFIFVTDVVRGLILAGKSPVTSGRIYNLAGGTPVTILSLLSALGRIVGKVPRPTFLPPRSGDVRESWADISRAWQDFEFAPEVTLEEGLLATVQWFERQTPLPVR
jgi:UDP-glucose 4-epimerase